MLNKQTYSFIKINSGKQLELCFFDEWADKFTKYADNRDSLGHVVMILQMARVKYLNGNFYKKLTFCIFVILHIQNPHILLICLDKPSVRPGLFTTKHYINDKLPEIEAFRQR